MSNVLKCQKWLEGYLTKRGKSKIEAVKKVARDKGFTRGQLNQSRENLKVVTTNDFDPVKFETRGWYWELKK